jgi:hypothetical protein
MWAWRGHGVSSWLCVSVLSGGEKRRKRKVRREKAAEEEEEEKENIGNI